ncbi:MAG: endonuclease/exonuclease/phosphatase family protein [Planctomycetota bacterium]|jgi:endonuclease/exonuclease/phosphatase family metal-dependent hydrolase
MAWPAASAHAQLRVVTWNISNYAGGRDQELQTAFYGVNPDNSLSMSPDVVLVQEILSAGALFDLRDNLNNAPGSPGDWLSAPFVNGNDTDSGLLYRTDKVQFLGLTVVSPGGAPPHHPRNIMRYDIRILGYPADAGTIACYGTHMKAGSGGQDQARRQLEAELIRADAALLPPNWQFLLGGDFNIQSSAELAYVELIGVGAAGAGRFFDPIKRPGEWNNDIVFRFVHTQDPAGAGGMDDRYDQILVSANLIDDAGVEYAGNANVPYSGSTWDDPNHSYRCWGNDGTSFNTTLRVVGNTMVGPVIAQALIDASAGAGHLPVYLDVDAAPFCYGDVDADGTVGVLDFLALLADWGPCPGCPSDLDEDGDVDVTDFLLLLTAWGDCP